MWLPGWEGRRTALVPVWDQCEICKQISLLEASGPPDEQPGWTVTLVTPEEAKRREDAKYGDTPT